ncbi:MAG: putative sporulation protein YtxC [Hyphomonadaceae bacterium]|nr:putative sporulation protein YtxC [Clostridia bacterium]
MECIKIGMTERADELFELVARTLSHSCYQQTISEQNGVRMLCIKAPSITDYAILKSALSDLLAKYLVMRYENKFMLRILRAKYFYFNATEKQEIIKHAIKNTRLSEQHTIINRFWAVEREQMIKQKLTEYFDNASDIILDGFANFRLKEYFNELEEIIEKAVDDYLMEKEYAEFIYLLKYFVDVQESKCDHVHVLKDFEGKYMLSNEHFEEIDEGSIDDYRDEVVEGLINEDDLLISALIFLAPKKVILHNATEFKNKELLKTICNVFGSRVELCEQCDYCFHTNNCQQLQID